jgi:hypothetical protein
MQLNTNSLKEILTVIQPVCDTFSFIVRDDFTETINELIAELSEYEIKKVLVNEWPGTKLLLDEAWLLEYHLNHMTANIINKYSDNIFSWIEPHLPEDLVFYKKGLPILISITHEQDVFFSNCDISQFSLIIEN